MYANVYETPVATLFFEPEYFDFGDRYQGRLYETVFNIWNSGTEPLYYTLNWDEPCISVNPTSGVSNGELDSITVTVDFNDVPLGSVTEEINIETNNNSGIFMVTANVVALPDLTLGAFKTGVFSLKNSISNLEAIDTPRVDWLFRLESGSIIFGYETAGSFEKIGAGETMVIQSSPVFGFGKTKIFGEICIDGELIEKREQDATVFLFFVIVKPGGG